MTTMLHIHVMEAKVMVADRNGLADPYCGVYVREAHVKRKKRRKIGLTEVVTLCREPVWDTVFSVAITDEELRTGILEFECWDRDNITDDFLGATTIEVNSLPAGRDSLAKWYPLLPKHAVFGSLSIGSIFIALAIEVCNSQSNTNATRKLLEAATNAYRHANLGLNWNVHVSTWNMGDADADTEKRPWLSRNWMRKALSSQENRVDDHHAIPSFKRSYHIFHNFLLRCALKRNSSKLVLSGGQVVNALMKARLCKSREDAIAVGEALVRMKLLLGTKLFNPTGKSKYTVKRDAFVEEQIPDMDTDYYDMYVIALLECSAHAKRDVGSAVRNYLGKANFNRLSTPVLGGGHIQLLVFIRKDLCHLVRFVEAATEATGIGGVVGNKGGIAVCMEICDTRVCFVGTHLAAHQDMTTRRNHDVAKIIHGVRMGYRHTDVLHQFHHVIWMGDLNYRLDYGDQGMEREPTQEQFDAVMERINAKEYDELLQYDQLRASQEDGECFIGFEEGKIEHPPTFKVERGKLLEYQRKRSPAWTDRILWMSLPGYRSSLRQIGLTSVNEMTTSDHKPVRADFMLHVNYAQPAVDSTMGECCISLTRMTLSGLSVQLAAGADLSELLESDLGGSGDSKPQSPAAAPASPPRATGRRGSGPEDEKLQSSSTFRQKRLSSASGAVNVPTARLKRSMIFIVLASPMMKNRKAKLPPRLSDDDGNRSWSVNDVEPIQLNVNDTRRLAQSFITVRVYIHGRTTTPKLGSSVIALPTLIGDSPLHELLQGELPFDAPVLRNGLLVGRISGALLVSWSNVGQQSLRGKPLKKRVSSGKDKTRLAATDDSFNIKPSNSLLEHGNRHIQRTRSSSLSKVTSVIITSPELKATRTASREKLLPLLHLSADGEHSDEEDERYVKFDDMATPSPNISRRSSASTADNAKTNGGHQSRRRGDDGGGDDGGGMMKRRFKTFRVDVQVPSPSPSIDSGDRRSTASDMDLRSGRGVRGVAYSVARSPPPSSTNSSGSRQAYQQQPRRKQQSSPVPNGKVRSPLRSDGKRPNGSGAAGGDDRKAAAAKPPKNTRQKPPAKGPATQKPPRPQVKAAKSPPPPAAAALAEDVKAITAAPVVSTTATDAANSSEQPSPRQQQEQQQQQNEENGAPVKASPATAIVASEQRIEAANRSCARQCSKDNTCRVQ